MTTAVEARAERAPDEQQPRCTPNTRSLHGTCEMTTAPVGGPEGEGGRGPRTDPATVRRHASRRFEAVVLVGDEAVGPQGRLTTSRDCAPPVQQSL